MYKVTFYHHVLGLTFVNFMFVKAKNEDFALGAFLKWVQQVTGKAPDGEYEFIESESVPFIDSADYLTF